MARIYRCVECNKYTLQEECNICKSKTIRVQPARYSPEDKYAHYRRKAKQQNVESN